MNQKACPAPLFDTSLSRLLLLMMIPLLFIPKINLLTFSADETAGLRIDDLILLCLTPLIFWAGIVTRRPLSAIEKRIGALLLFSLLSFGINRLLVAEELLFVDAKLTYALRIFEYFLFFYVGSTLASPKKLTPFLYAFLGLNAVLMIAQKFGLAGQFSNYGYIREYSGRVMGVASFPSEMGAVLNLLFAYLLFIDARRFTGPRLAALVLLFGPLTVMTGSRSALMAMLILFSAKCLMLLRQRSGKTTVIALFSLSIALFGVAAWNSQEIKERSSALFSKKNVELATRVWQAVDTHYNPTGSEAVRYKSLENDKSWWVRIHKWCYASKLFLEHPECYLQGIGPGFATAGLDGGLLRIAVEYGLVGAALFFSFFSRIASVSIRLKWMIAALLINMLFFDAYLAYKPMSFLFLAAGADQQQKSSICYN